MKSKICTILIFILAFCSGFFAENLINKNNFYNNIKVEKKSEVYFSTKIDEDEKSYIERNFVNIIKDENKKLSSSKIPNEEVAAKIAESVWIPIYGEEEILFQRPYSVSYYEDLNAWYVRGNLPTLPEGKVWLRGTAQMFIDKNTGEIIFVTHTE